MSILEGLISFWGGYFCGYQDQKRNNEIQMQHLQQLHSQERIRQLEFELQRIRQGLYYYEDKKPD